MRPVIRVLVAAFGAAALITGPLPVSAATANSQLNGVSCTTATACTAVGSNSVHRALIERWDGTSWAIQSPGVAATNGRLSGVSCPAVNACTAVGWYNGNPTATLVERWEGAAWQVQITPNPSSGGRLVGVSCPTVNVCFAVGQGVNQSGGTMPLVERWNGTAWHIQPTPTFNYAVLHGVSCVSASDCTAVGEYQFGPQFTLAEHWNGTRWSVESTPDPPPGNPSLLSVSCFTGGCLAVGYYIPTSGCCKELVESWDGSSWTIKPTPDSPVATAISALTGISCFTGSIACEAVGWIKGSIIAPEAARWDGTAWTWQSTSSPGGAVNAFNGISCRTIICTAVGYTDPDNTGTADRTLAERWNGGAWRQQATP